MNSKLLSILLFLGLAITLLGAITMSLHWEYAAPCLIIGGAALTISYINTHYDTSTIKKEKVIRVKRMHTQQIFSGISILGAGLCGYYLSTTIWIILLTYGSIGILWSSFVLDKLFKSSKSK
ncbi:MAG: hypothetical protein WCR36_02795 [Bacteroidaceae bacterium]